MAGPKKILELSSKNRYTVTLDDDVTVHKYVEKAIGIPSQYFLNSESFLAKYRQLRPLGFFLDIHLGLESENGIDLVPNIKQAFPSVPIIIMTSDLDETLLARALEVGADDFIKKPIVATELKARFNARLISLREKIQNKLVRYGDLSLDPFTGKLSGNGQNAVLSSLESKILAMLMKAQGQLIAKELIKLEAWGKESVTDNALSRKVHEVRKAVESIGSILVLESNYSKGFSLRNTRAHSSPIREKAAA